MKLQHSVLLLTVLTSAALPVPAQDAVTSTTNGAVTVTARLDTILEEPNVHIVVPAPPCAVPAVAGRVLQSVGIPAGIEYAPESCAQDPARVPVDWEAQTLAGLTAREALRRLVAIDPRYHWIESNDMVVIRPLSAWNDSLHFLNRTAASFHIDAANFSVALNAVQMGFVGWPLNADPASFGGRTPQGSRPISVHLDVATSAYEGLNAVVRAHGSLRWRVTYCGQPARHEYATIWLETYDGSGLGSHPAVLTDVSGKRFSPCSLPR